MSDREREMPFFETKTRIDWQEYWRMYLRLLRKSWIIWVVLLLTAGCVAIAVVRNSPLPLLFGVVFLGVYGVSLQKGARKSFAKDEKNRDRVIRYTFYPSFFIAEDGGSRAEVTYAELKKMEETGADFYLVLNGGALYPVGKKDAPEGLCAFLHEKKKTRRKK